MVSASLVKALRERTGLGFMDCKAALVETEGDLDKAVELMRKRSAIKSEKKQDRATEEGLLSIKVAEDRRSALLVEVNTETDFLARGDDVRTFLDTLLQDGFARQAASCEALMNEEMEALRKELVQKVGENIRVSNVFFYSVDEGQYIAHYIHSDFKQGSVVVLDSSDDRLGKDLAMHVIAMKPLVVSGEDIDPQVITKERDIIEAQTAAENKPANIIEKIIEGRLKSFIASVSMVEQPFVKDSKVTVGELLKKHNAKCISISSFTVGSTAQ